MHHLKQLIDIILKQLKEIHTELTRYLLKLLIDFS
jgi:hypothetical protein